MAVRYYFTGFIFFLALRKTSGVTEEVPELESTCSNGIKDNHESDVDCGQDCFELCQTGQRCLSDFDCESWSCVFVDSQSRCAERRSIHRFLGESGSSGASGAAEGNRQKPKPKPKKVDHRLLSRGVHASAFSRVLHAWIICGWSLIIVAAGL